MLTRLSPVVLLLALMLIPAPARAEKPSLLDLAQILKLAGKVSPTEVIAFLEGLTARDRTKVEARLRKLVPQMQLRVHTARVDVVVRAEQLIWRGITTLKLTLPADVEYVLDLKAMQPADLTWDRASRRLTVRLPAVRVGLIAPCLEEERLERISPLFRPKWFEGGDLTKLERKLRREDWRPKAREVAESRLDDARKAARAQVKELLKKLLLPVGSDIEVVVE